MNARISTINREILATDERLAGRTERQMLLQRTADDLAAIDAQLSEAAVVALMHDALDQVTAAFDALRRRR